MAQFEDTVPALDVGASVAQAADVEDLRAALEGVQDERLQIAMDILDEFEAIDDATGWKRLSVASMLGCDHPDPRAWLEVDEGELAHSRTVVRLIREVAVRAASFDVSAREESLRGVAAFETDEGALAVARRETSRSAVRLCKDLLRQARGSAFAVARALDDGEILRLVAADEPGDAGHLGRSRLLNRSNKTWIIEANIGDIALIDRDESEPEVSGLDDIRAAISSGIHASK